MAMMLRVCESVGMCGTISVSELELEDLGWEVVEIEVEIEVEFGSEGREGLFGGVCDEKETWKEPWAERSRVACLES